MTLSRFWPVAESSQADYEAMRKAVVDNASPSNELAFARFSRRGLFGLIAWPSAEPAFLSALLGASRPPWSPYDDPRIETLAAAYGLLVSSDERSTDETRRKLSITRPPRPARAKLAGDAEAWPAPASSTSREHLVVADHGR
jgi:hypothetical protein